MIPLKEALMSSLGKKYLTAVSGLGMVGFVVTHLLGNLQLYFPDKGVAFNKYALGLHDLGPILWAMELGLVAMALTHIVVAIGITLKSKSARREGYKHGLQTKGGPSYNSMGARGMAISGTILLIFLVVHVMHMKYGFFSSDKVNAAMVDLNGKKAFDLYGRVKEAFVNPGWVVFYMACMTLLFAHLRHGFFSAFQSLGALNWRMEKPMNILSKVIAASLAVGFLGIPVYFFVRFGLGG